MTDELAGAALQPNGIDTSQPGHIACGYADVDGQLYRIMVRVRLPEGRKEETAHALSSIPRHDRCIHLLHLNIPNPATQTARFVACINPFSFTPLWFQRHASGNEEELFFVRVYGHILLFCVHICQ